MAADDPFAAFAGQHYLNLETWRRDGRAVRTPLWFAAAPGGEAVLYAYTLADSGKVKRLRRSAEARIAPCDGRGRVTGGWVAVRATLVSGAASEQSMRLLDRKYWPWKQLMGVLRLLRPRERVVIAMRPVGAE